MAEKIYGPGDALPAEDSEDTATEFPPGTEHEPEEDEQPDPGEGDEAV